MPAHFIFFSGKGGVGKTSMACATAVHHADEGRKTLIVTTDPASNLADVFEQIGYQQESPSVRNSFLAAALELRSGIPTGASPKTGGPDMIRAMTTELWLDFLGIRLDSKKAEGNEFTINLITGASTAPDCDGVLAEADAINYRMPYQSDPEMRGKTNSGEMKY